jgi:hypothetical protein
MLAALGANPAGCVQNERKLFYFYHNIDEAEKAAPKSGIVTELQRSRSN